MTPSFKMYLGLSEEHVVPFEGYMGTKLCANEDALKAFKALQADAKTHGFDIQPCSAFRSFERQAAIFSAKFNGIRPILDINEEPLTPIPEDPVERLNAMLLFSAMPGFSRHHFGSDFDIYAPNKLPEGQSLQLTYHEYLEGSYFYELGLYLNEALAKFDFYNPYSAASTKSAESKEPQAKVSVGFEPWHISHKPSAKPFIEAYDIEAALSYVESADLPYSKYVRTVMSPDRIESMLHLCMK